MNKQEKEFEHLNLLDIPNSTSNSDGSVSIKISKETIEKLLDWVYNEQRRLKGLPKREKTTMKFQ